MLIRTISTFCSGLRATNKRFASYRRDTKAAAAVELALTFPLFILFMMIILELTMFHFATSTVQQGVFNYSRRLATMSKTGKASVHNSGIDNDIRLFVGNALIAKFIFEIGPVTEKTDFKKKLTKNSLKDFTTDKTKPFYLRVVAKRQTFTYTMFKPVWDVVCNPDNGGLFSDIDVLVVAPWPPEDQSS